MAKKRKCETCIYGFHPSSGYAFCQYLLVTGKLRPCPGGKECTEYKKGRAIHDRGE